MTRLREKYEQKNLKKDEQSGLLGWMTTYGDMMTLLLCFFVLLYSISVIEIEKFERFIAYFQDRPDIMEGGETILSEDSIAGCALTDEAIIAVDESAFNELYAKFKRFTEEEGLETVYFEKGNKGLVISFADNLFFELGCADLNPHALKILEKTALFLHEIENGLKIEGHTDNLPIDTERFPSNWELSVLRATTVARFLTEKEGIDPKRVEVSGFSENQPVESNKTKEGRARNRRVDILIRAD